MQKLETIPVISTRSECDSHAQLWEFLTFSASSLSLSLCLPGGKYICLCFFFYQIFFFWRNCQADMQQPAVVLRQKSTKKDTRRRGRWSDCREKVGRKSGEKRDRHRERKRERIRKKVSLNMQNICVILVIRVYYDMQTDADWRRRKEYE